MIRIVKAEQTCWACPSAWDAWAADGRYLYLRYRYGRGTVRHYPDPDDHSEYELITEFDFGHPLDGCLDLDEFCALAGITLDLWQ